MLEELIKEVCIVLTRGCIQGMEVGGGEMLDLFAILNCFPFRSFKLGDLVGPVSDFGLVVEEGGIWVVCLQPDAPGFKPPGRFFFR